MNNAREKYMLALANLVNGSELGYEDRSSIPQYKKDIEDYVGSLEKVNKEYEEAFNKVIEYIEIHKLDYKSEGKLIATEFDSLSSPYYLLSILKEVDKEVE